MSISWASSPPAILRAHHAQDAIDRAGDLPADVTETSLAPAGDFRGGLLFTPVDRAQDAIILYFHGGGFVAGSPETHRCLTAWLAKLSGMRVLSARYGLAPEYPFPTQRDDAAAACAAALAASDAAADRTQLFLAGDSAGACVALWAWQGLTASQRARIKGLILFYGGYGHVEGDSIARYGTTENGLDSHTLSIMYGRLGKQAAAPIWPRDFAHQITAPAYVLAAGLDAVFDDSATLFRRLPAVSARTFVVVDGQDHGFLKGAGKDLIALQELTKAARWITAAFARTPLKP
jgi:acetyl esterase